MAAVAPADYKFPPFHSFPPSYTRQPIEGTRAKQSQLWCDLVRDYCRVHRVFWLDIASDHASKLFRNPAIGRRLSDGDIMYFLDRLVTRGDGVWNQTRSQCLVYWRRPSEWGELIFQWINDTCQGGVVFTVYELRTSTTGQGTFPRAAAAPAGRDRFAVVPDVSALVCARIPPPRGRDVPPRAGGSGDGRKVPHI
jgi:ESCRT-II complex subunit VPS25